MPDDAKERGFADEAKARAKLLFGFVGVLWAVHLVNLISGGWLYNFGVVPRTLGGLMGILAAPFLHGGWAHLAANSLSILGIGFILMLRNRRDVFTVGLLSALTSGLGAWLIGPANSVHVGASGVIFGLLGYLLSRGYFERKVWPIIGSVFGVLVFAGSLRGLFPGQAGISWQMHLFGFLGGILAARLSASPRAAEAASPQKPRARIAAAPVRARVAEPAAEGDVDEDLEALKRRMQR